MISIKGLKFNYGSAPVLKGINLEIGAGERLALMGANGSGKTTLALLIAGLLSPEEGEILVEGFNPGGLAPGKIGMVFQNPEEQLCSVSVEREIAFGLENLGIEHNEMLHRVEQALIQFDLVELRYYPPHRLSGGQVQKVALASVMAMAPEYLILDEPTSLLDPPSRGEFWSSLRQLPLNVSIIYITPFANEALNFPRLIALKEGEVFFDGEPGKFFLNEQYCDQVHQEPPVKYRLQKMLLKAEV